jgi:hypothetical protein
LSKERNQVLTFIALKRTISFLSIDRSRKQLEVMELQLTDCFNISSNRPKTNKSKTRKTFKKIKVVEPLDLQLRKEKPGCHKLYRKTLIYLKMKT